MKACVVQTRYLLDSNEAKKEFNNLLTTLDELDSSVDLVVLPEYSDVPCKTNSKQEFFSISEEFNPILLKKASQTARRINAVVFANALSKENEGYKNTTYAFNRQGEVVCKYFKQHLTQNEINNLGLDFKYTYDREPICTVDIDGVKYGFLTCYDFYFYEMFPRLYKENIDVIIGCCHQRTDTHEILSVINKFCAYNTGAYLVRASVSMGEDSLVGGCSSIISPSMQTLVDLKSAVGVGFAEFNPKQKYLKPAGYQNPCVKHGEYVEMGKRPVKYRNGQEIVRPDSCMDYPRTSASVSDKNFDDENALEYIAKKVALGVDEIQLDVFDYNGELVVLTKLECPKKPLSMEKLFEKFALKVIFNISLNKDYFSRKKIDKIVNLAKEYDCLEWIYFSTSNELFLKELKKNYPLVATCAAGDCDEKAIMLAKKYNCEKIALKEKKNLLLAKNLGYKAIIEGDEKDKKDLIENGAQTIIIKENF